EDNFNNEIITYNGKIIIGVNEIDALRENTTPNELAEKFKTIISNKIEEHREQNSFKVKLIRAGEFLLIVIAVILILRLLNKLINKIKNRIISNNKLLENGLTFKKHQIFKHQQLISFISRIFVLVKVFIFLIVIFSSLPIALKIFPQTSVWANEMQNMILEPIKSLLDSIVAYLPKLVKIV